MHWLDWSVVALYLGYIVFDGVRFARKSEGVEGYFLASRSLPWWAVGLSVMATQLSAITLVGTTGQAFDDGMRFIQFYFGLPFAMIILSVTVVPFFYRAKVFTAYEYLEKRFDAKTRSLTSFLFLMSRGLSCGVIIAAPSVILSLVLGWDRLTTILAMGLTTTIYTVVGGVRAVTWTDVKQMVIIFLGLGAVLVVILSSLPDGVTLGGALDVAGAAGRLQTIDATFDPAETYTLWSGLIGGLFLMLSYFGCDQSQVQRFLTARSVNEGRTSLLMSAFVKIPMQFVILLVGVLVFVFYQFVPVDQAPPLLFDRAQLSKLEGTPAFTELAALRGPYERAHQERLNAASEIARDVDEATRAGAVARYRQNNDSVTALRRQAREIVRRTNGAASYTDVNFVFPTFVTTHLPIGIVGLMIAAIFAAAMSSISAELNALATATVIDFYRRHVRPNASDRHMLAAGRMATAFWGVFACVAAYYAANLGSLIEVVNRFGSFFYGSLLGVFVLAIGTRRATARGAFVGLICGMLVVATLNYAPELGALWQTAFGSDALARLAPSLKVSFLWHNLVGCLVVVLVGLVLSGRRRGADSPNPGAPAPDAT